MAQSNILKGIEQDLAVVSKKFILNFLEEFPIIERGLVALALSIEHSYIHEYLLHKRMVIASLNIFNLSSVHIGKDALSRLGFGGHKSDCC